jgi:hypothetical protein
MERREAWTELDRYEVDAAIYVSQTSRELATMLDGSRPWGHLQFPPLELNSGASDMVPSVMGMYKALVEAQLAVGVITGPVAHEAQGGPRVLCLPGVLAIDDDEAAWIERYVAQGGGLVATGPTSLYDPDGEQRSSLRLHDLFGVELTGADPAPYTYVQELGHSRPIPQYLATLDVRMTDPGTEVIAGRRRPIIDTRGELYFHNNQAAPWTELAAPALVRRAHGRGRVVFAPGSPDGNVARLGSEDHARMLVEAVRWASGREPLVQTDGPTTTRVIAGWQGDDLVVHLVTAAPDLTVRHGADRTLETITRMPRHHDVRLQLSLPVVSATLEPDGTALPVTRDGARRSVSVESMSDWETVRFTLG